MATIMLVEPENSGNIGAVARAMKNFGIEKLLLVNPKAEINEESFRRAKHAKQVLLKAKKVSFEEIKKYDLVVGTTAKTGKDYNLKRAALTPEQASKIIRKHKNPLIVFGREGEGLTNKEIERCDIIINIPTAKYYALNLSHAAAVVFYELHKSSETDKINYAGNKEKKKLSELINEVIEKQEFRTKEKKDTQKILWKRMLGKTLITKREIQALFGFFKKFK